MPPVGRSVRRSTAEGRCPWYFSNAGFGSNMSSCEGPPTMKSTMLCLALGGKLGNFGGVAPVVAAARACSSDNIPRRPMEPRPPVREAIQSRRERWFGLLVGKLFIDIHVG